MHGDALGPKLLDAHGGVDHIGFRSAPCVAQGGDLVHVDAEPCHPYLGMPRKVRHARPENPHHGPSGPCIDRPGVPGVDGHGRMQSHAFARGGGRRLQGTVSEAELLEMDDLALIARPSGPRIHWHGLAPCTTWWPGWAGRTWTCSVVHRGLYRVRGSVVRHALLAKRAGWGFPGSTIVVEVLPKI